MACEHFFILTPHRVCEKCGLIDDEYIDCYRYNEILTDHTHKKQIRLDHEILSPKYLVNGVTETIKLNNKIIKLRSNWADRRKVIGMAKIRLITDRIQAHQLQSIAIEKYLKWIDHPWMTNPNEPHTHLYPALYATAIWWAMRKYHYPMTFTRFTQLMSEYHIKNLNNKLIQFQKNIGIVFPAHDLAQQTHTFCDIYRHDPKFQERISAVTPKVNQINDLITTNALKIANRLIAMDKSNRIAAIQKNNLSNEEIAKLDKTLESGSTMNIMALSIFVFTACHIQDRLLKKGLIKKPARSDLVGDMHFQEAFGVGRTYINKKIKTLMPKFQMCLREV